MEKKIEKMGHFLVPSSTSEGVVDALRSLADKLNEIIDHLNSQAQPEENEEWEKRFIRTFGYWGEEIKFIKQLLKEREREEHGYRVTLEYVLADDIKKEIKLLKEKE